MGVYVSAGISGGHLNPAVTLAMSVSGKLKWKKVPIYMLGQYLGAFVGALFVYLIYYGNLSSNCYRKIACIFNDKGVNLN